MSQKIHCYVLAHTSSPSRMGRLAVILKEPMGSGQFTMALLPAPLPSSRPAPRHAVCHPAPTCMPAALSESCGNQVTVTEMDDCHSECCVNRFCASHNRFCLSLLTKSFTTQSKKCPREHASKNRQSKSPPAFCGCVLSWGQALVGEGGGCAAAHAATPLST